MNAYEARNCRPRIESAGGLDSKAFGTGSRREVCVVAMCLQLRAVCEQGETMGNDGKRLILVCEILGPLIHSTQEVVC